MLKNCHRCGCEFALPTGYLITFDSLSIKADYCSNCVTSTNARFSAIYGGK
jgi:hypothetical protein